ncbi:hypothetical protein M5J15_16785 (plasmid) [Serratia symbiotica]|nr:group II intron maturase-specific domain-containing protein [Serratia symbiotica]USS96947.1 hypothetical protein M5J15_16785 [Serratia symbiotica]
MKINPILKGWGNYFRICNSRMHFMSIETTRHRHCASCC